MRRGRTGVSPPSPEDETHSVSKTLFFLLIRITDDGQTTETEDSGPGPALTDLLCTMQRHCTKHELLFYAFPMAAAIFTPRSDF
jgi:hypothetical protein